MENVFVIAEMSANHLGSKRRALELIQSAANAGADAIKFQHYKVETMIAKGSHPDLMVNGGTIWDGTSLMELYEQAQTPWEWTEDLVEEAHRLGIQWLSSPFDASAVDFLEQFDIPMYKIASFEIVDLPLIEYVASKGKPIIISTGMATEDEISVAVETAVGGGAKSVSILRCNSAYPAPVDQMDLVSIPRMIEKWKIPVGLSDHTIGSTSAVVAVSLGATIIEKHLTLRRGDGGPDAAFSAEPNEFKRLVEEVDIASRALGSIRFGPSVAESASLRFRRSLRIVKEIGVGEILTSEHVRSVRPSGGMLPSQLGDVLGKRVARCLVVGDPLRHEDVDW